MGGGGGGRKEEVEEGVKGRRKWGGAIGRGGAGGIGGAEGLYLGVNNGMWASLLCSAFLRVGTAQDPNFPQPTLCLQSPRSGFQSS